MYALDYTTECAEIAIVNNPIFLTDQELLKGIALLRENARILEELSNAQPNQLTPQDHALLRTLYLFPNYRAQEIASRMCLSKQSLSRSIKNLELRGYIETRSDPEDRRVKRLLLSTKGLQSYTTRQKYALKTFYRAYQHAGITAVEGFNHVQHALAAALERVGE
ncbi:MAG: MarR family transcriptional regulator [Alphaproteobacteria bacterium]|nr:MarR family transcriptional regulator [Alphaproteobacteria bacterium]